MGARCDIQGLLKNLLAESISFLWGRHVRGMIDGALAAVLAPLDFSVTRVSNLLFVFQST